jgi:hypothetical protein
VRFIVTSLGSGARSRPSQFCHGQQFDAYARGDIGTSRTSAAAAVTVPEVSGRVGDQRLHDRLRRRFDRTHSRLDSRLAAL